MISKYLCAAITKPKEEGLNEILVTGEGAAM